MKAVWSLVLLLVLLITSLVGCGGGSGREEETSNTQESLQVPSDLTDPGTVLFVQSGAASEGADGSVDAPYGVLGDAFAKAKELLATATESAPVTVTVVLGHGEYRLSETEAFVGGEAASYGALNIVAAVGAEPVVAGWQSIDATGFTKVEGTDYYLYQVAPDAKGKYPFYHELYVDGVRASLAESETYVNQSHFTSDYAFKQKGMYVPKALAERLPADDLAGLEYYLEAEWEFYVVEATGIDFEDTKTSGSEESVMLILDRLQLQTWINGHNGILKMSKRNFKLRNHPALIDEGGEFAYDANTGRLWYRPVDGKSITDSQFALSDLETLISFSGMKHVTVQGITFSGTNCTQIPQSGYISAQANGDTREGVLKMAALYAENTEDMTVKGCRFSELGNNGVMLRGSTDTAKIIGNDFCDIAMSAIFVGEQSYAWSETNATVNLEISDNLVENVGFSYPSAVAIFVGLVKDGKILHNTIRHVPYTGINVGWGWSTADFKYGESYRVNNVEVAYNRIENYMQTLRDGGAIYILGSSAEVSYTEYFNFLHDNYAVRENGTKSHAAFYLDEATANWHLYDNVSVGTSQPLALQHQAGTFVKNILCERLYADQYKDTANHDPGRNVHVNDSKISSTLFETYAEAKAIADNAGCSRA